MRNAGLEETQAGIKITGRNINNLRYADDTTLTAKREEELKNLLIKVKEETEKVDLSSTFRKQRSWDLVPSLHGKYMGKQWVTLFFWAPKSLQNGDCSHEIKRCLLLGRKVMTNLDRLLKSRNITLPTKVRLVKAMVFPVVTYGCWELNYKESWAPMSWFFWTVVLEKTLESPLDSKEIQSVHPEGNQSWIFIGRTDPEVETPILWPPDAKNWLIWKAPDAGKDWRWEGKGMTEDEMVRWHHQLNGLESE